jgi:eukaryotic-like serine/threonine-protein kinase
MSDSSDGPTIDFRPPDATPTLTRVGTDGGPREAPANFAPPGYEILEELGRGGMGVVYKARQKSLNRLVALKVILGAGHAGADQLARFRAEATAAAQLQHPNIVQVFEVGEHEGQPFFSLELVDGGSLADRLRGEPQPPRDAADLVRTLAVAVHHAHERGVVHRDLKPANVLLTGDRSQESGVSKDLTLTPVSWLRSPKVTDFGLAKQRAAESHLTASGAILGTPSYMAPEQAAGDKAVGPSADVYALGAILYECLTGRPPFRAAAVMDTVLQVLHDDPVPPSRLQPKLPRDLETICLKCLAKKPEGRYASAAALADDLGRFLNGDSILARPASPVTKLWRWAWRHPALATVAFVLAVPLPVLSAAMVYLWADARAARKAAEADRAAALEARDRADRERELAQGYLTNALGTMEKVLDRVGDGPLWRVPEAQEERTAILADAVAFYESLLRLDSTDPAVRFDTAQTYHRVSRLANLAGNIDQAEAAGRNAIRMLTDLVSEYPERPAYQNELARAHMFLGHARLLTGDNEGAVAEYRKAADVADDLLGRYPNDPAYKTTAAECRRSLGYYHMIARPADAKQHFEKALQLADDAFAAVPDTDHRALLASVLGAYGQFLVATRQLPKAEDLLNRAAELLDSKAGPPPRGMGRMNYDQAQLGTWYALGLIYAQTKRLDRAEVLARKAVRHCEDLMAGKQKAFPYRLQGVQAYALLAQLTRSTQKNAEAARASGRAVELLDGVMRDYPAFAERRTGAWIHQLHQSMLALNANSLLGDGQRDAAARVAARLDPDSSGLTGVLAYNVACMFALMSAGSDGSVRDEYAAKAMTWLNKAAATGYPATASDVEHVRTADPDLKVLRDRPEFQEWAKTLKPAKK